MRRGHGPKDWRPYSAANDPEKIASTLQRLAPSFSYDVHWDLDSHLSWDGDPQDNPRDAGLSPYSVEFSMLFVLRGQVVRETSHIGGVWDDPNNPDADVHGYLPQKFLEVTEGLLDRRLEISDGLRVELEDAQKFLKDVLHIRYKAQRHERRGG
jgi:hypothetical protein